MEEFDAFVKGFRIERRLESIRAAEAAMSATALADEGSPPAAPFIPIVAQSIASAEPIAAVASETPVPRAVRSRSVFDDTRVRWAVAVIAIAALALFVWRPWRRATSTPPVSAATTSAAPAPVTSAPPQPSPATPPPVPPPASPRALNLELVTIRPVWTRVTVDDKRIVEREIPGGQRLPLGADRSISIRAGDAGAIRVIVDGKDLGALGKDGQIANRSFAARGR